MAAFVGTISELLFTKLLPFHVIKTVH